MEEDEETSHDSADYHGGLSDCAAAGITVAIAFYTVCGFQRNMKKCKMPKLAKG